MNSSRKVFWKLAVMSVLAMIFAGAGADAQSVYIRTRPLTPQEITNAGLTNTTQLANGVRNVGVGMPIYLEALVTTSGTMVTNVTWIFLNQSTNSHSDFLASPLLTNVVASFDVGDRNTFKIAGRAVLVPDIAGTKTNNDFIVRVAVALTNKTIYATNSCYGSVYVGCADLPWGPTGEGMCITCHNGPDSNYKMDSWAQTAHATAFKRKINGLEGSFSSSCASCHVVGYDATASATNGGFDDIMKQFGWTWPTNLTGAALLANPMGATNNWDSMPALLQNKANIQCESCHGPADRHLRKQDSNAIGLSISAGNCGSCHDKMTHHVKNYEWNQSFHGSGIHTYYRPFTYYTNYPTIYSTNYLGGVVANKNNGGVVNLRFNSSCGYCHTGQGFILNSDPDWAGETNPAALGTSYEGLTCAVCHDPHGVGMGDYQLRDFPNVILANYYTNTLGGISRLCMQCHHGRSNAYELDMVKAPNNPASAPTPHHGPQGDMMIGQNAIEYGMQMPRSRHIDVLEDGCVECHMAETPTSGLAMNHLGGHTWSLSYTTNSTTYELTETCVKCHGEIEGFNFGGIDYDHDGVVEGVQAEVQGLMDTLAKLLPYSNTSTRVISYGTTNVPSPAAWWKLAEKKGGFNYLFVWEDRSKGVHNPKYATAVLQASIDDLRGGIDVDRNGLLDSWEISNFHGIGQDPNGDPDHDNVINRLEMAAGTDPNDADTDHDLYSDGVELAAGTDPLSASSSPSSRTNTVSMLPAYELAFLPVTQGATQQFQSVDALGGGWTKVGTNFITSTNAWYYQLISIQNATQRFFRVTTTN
ncbi:MAG: thrombospondin type 3 repeat-containing protein [bacterium]